METRVLTMMLTDIKGFTQKTSHSSREALKKLLDDHERLLYPVFRYYQGTLVKTIGDALLITFESPTNAVLCGIAMQERLRVHNEGLPEDEHLMIRVAINSGEVQIRDGDVFGEAVNITARIEGITDAGEIYFTESVYLAMNKAEVPTSEVGEKRLKGIPESIRVYKVIQDPMSEKFRHLQEEISGINLDESVEVPFSSQDELRHEPAASNRMASIVVPFGSKKKPRILAAAILAFAVVAGAIGYYLLRDPAQSYLSEFSNAIAASDYVRGASIVDQLLADFPQREETHQAVKSLVSSQVDDLLKDGKYDRAIVVIDDAEAKYKPRLFDSLRKEALLGKGEQLAENWSYREIAPVYAELLKRYSDDTKVLGATMQVMGPQAKGGPTKLAESAAMMSLEKESMHLDTQVAMLALRYLANDVDAYSDEAKKYRKLIRQRFTDYETIARAELKKQECKYIAHPYLLLNESDRLMDSDQILFSFRLLFDRCNGVRDRDKLLFEAVNYVNDNAGRSDWSDRKSAAGLRLVNQSTNLDRGGFYKHPAAAVLIKGFLAELEPILLKALEGDGRSGSDEDFQRTNAWYLLKNTNKELPLTEWDFHQTTLSNYGGRFQPQIVDDAIDYFFGHDDKQRAREVLTQAQMHFNELRQEEVKRGEGEIETSTQYYLGRLEVGLKS
ncbi:MAG: adenylate/guanylate cyclase domain-containing protein [Gammaproteobacteria bacterium]|nr:MAG: adenylate/guanylate cyclase domain-containing protein [Gammaproteobacteria bacterium]